MANTDAAIEERRKYVEAWNRTMVDIWRERMVKLGVIDSGALWRSAIQAPVRADGRFYDITLSYSFLEYGLWQDFGTGREFGIGNSGDVPSQGEPYRTEHDLNRPRKRGPKWGEGYTSGEPRAKRRWFSPKYYRSVMNLRDFLGTSLGREFISFFTNFDADEIRRKSNYYRRKGLS